jgi:hypothetical protein
MILQALADATGSWPRVRAVLFNTARAGVALALLITMFGIPAIGLAKGKPRPPPEPPPAEPPARYWHAFAGNGSSDSGTSRLFLLGGSGDASTDYETFADFWYYSVENRQWVLAPTGTSKPGGRNHAGLSCGAGECVTCNGVRIGPLKETWVYRERSGTWSQINCRKQLCPSARMMVAMAYDPDRFYHLLFGGLNGRESLDDTWSFAGGTWVREQPDLSPPARGWAAMTYVGPPVDGIVLFGGLTGYVRLFDDMWVWDGNAWQLVALSGGLSPPSLYGHSMAWDGGRLLVTGGYVDNNDTPNTTAWSFTFDGARSGKWSKEPDASGCYSSVNPGAMMAHDRSQKLKVFFGGAENGPNGVVAYDDTVICE